MAIATERITRDVRDIYPRAACLPCLAARAELAEADARRAAQAPVTRGELRLVRGICHWCQRVSNALVGVRSPRLDSAA
jgi:hypothetical protein